MTESPRHELDEVIDRVAARMVAIEDDGALMARVMARLPERAATPWFMAMPVQLAAATAMVLVAFLYARPSRETVPVEGPGLAAAVGEVAPIPDPRALNLVASPTVARQDRSRRVPVAIDRPDHERSLAPVDAIGALELGGIAPSTLELDAPASLEPLVLTDLALDTKGDR